MWHDDEGKYKLSFLALQTELSQPIRPPPASELCGERPRRSAWECRCVFSGAHASWSPAPNSLLKRAACRLLLLLVIEESTRHGRHVPGAADQNAPQLCTSVDVAQPACTRQQRTAQHSARVVSPIMLLLHYRKNKWNISSPHRVFDEEKDKSPYASKY
jgi:hypothetical protein